MTKQTIAPINEMSATQNKSEIVSSPTALLLFLLPVAAGLSRWAYFPPGEERAFYLYRILLIIISIGAFVALFRGVRITYLHTLSGVTIFMLILWIIFFKPPVSLDPDVSFQRTYGLLIQLIALYSTIWVLKGSQKRLNIFATGMVVSLIIQTIIGLWEVRTHNHLQLLIGEPWPRSDLGAPVASFQNPNNFVMFLVMMFPVLATIYFRTDKKRIKLLFITSYVSTFVLIIAASSVMAMFVFAILTVIVAYNYSKNKGGTLIFFALIGSAGYVIMASIYKFSIAQYASRVFSEGDEQSLWIRIVASRMAYGEWRKHMFFGNEPGTFEAKQALGILPSPIHVPVNPHNTLLQIPMEFGLVVALPFFLLLGYLTLNLFFQKHPVDTVADAEAYEENLLRARLIFIGFIGASFVASSLMIEGTWWQFLAYVCGLVECMDHVRATRPTIESAELALPPQAALEDTPPTY